MFAVKFATVCGPASSLTVGGFAASVKVGASLTDATEMMNVRVRLVSTPPLVVPPSSVIVTLKVAVPFVCAVGWYVSVPFVGSKLGAVKKVKLPVLAV